MRISKAILWIIPLAVIIVGIIGIVVINMNNDNSESDLDSEPDFVWDTLVWADEFNYTGFPDPNKWRINTYPPGWVNNESQNYVIRLENSRVENGTLILEARRDWYGGHEYSSARISTLNYGNWTYGRFEARAILPSGRGIWPAIWMMPKLNVYGSWPRSGEIDIMEYVGHTPGIIYGTVHTSSYYWVTGTQKGGTLNVPDCETNYHIYAIEWFADRIDFFVDDIKYFTFHNENTSFKEWPFDHEFYFILNIAVGGFWGGEYGIDDSIFPQQMVVDYIRVYQ